MDAGQAKKSQLGTTRVYAGDSIAVAAGALAGGDAGSPLGAAGSAAAGSEASGFSDDLLGE